jgi:hypothetical protein
MQKEAAALAGPQDDGACKIKAQQNPLTGQCLSGSHSPSRVALGDAVIDILKRVGAAYAG